jgi:integrase/recombinase XerD
VAPAGPADELAEAFRCYLVTERGLQPSVAADYVRYVRPFVAGCAARPLAEVTPGDVTGFLAGLARRMAPKSVQAAASALRSLLRFWHVQGLTSGPLQHAVPKVANRRPGLPRPLEPRQIRAMLGSCDPGTAAGLRDLAMLTLMARLGLRAGEAAGLRLEDISWREGTIAVRGKGNRRDQLPLPPDAGAAIARYLQHGRPGTATDRSVFIRVPAPHRGLGPGAVTAAVARAAGRAGLGTIHAHRLRHSAATSVLAAGGSLAEAVDAHLKSARPAH